jgi:hypothetical protein
MPLTNAKFDPIHTGRADPSRYLIIGFDTEYQRYADEDRHTFNTESVNLITLRIFCTIYG